MTKSATSSTQTAVKGYSTPAAKSSDEAPMIITRLSGWIDMGEARTARPHWIIPTRVHGQER